MPTSVDLLGPAKPSRLGDRLLSELADDRWTEARAAVAYVKMSGVQYLANPLSAFTRAGKRVCMTVGIDQQGSSLEGVQTLWQIIDGHGELYALHNPTSNPSSTFHPKLWLLSSPDEAMMITGSGNLTAGGLFTNYELGTAIGLRLDDPGDRDIYDKTMDILKTWADPQQPEVTLVSPKSLRLMHDTGELPSENSIRSAGQFINSVRASVSGVKGGLRNAISGLFESRPVNSPPPKPASLNLPAPPVTPKRAARIASTTAAAKSVSPDSTDKATSSTQAAPSPIPLHEELLMMISQRRKTEVYLAKQFLKDDPAFFGWPFLGLTKPKKDKNDGHPQPEPPPTAYVVVYKENGHVDDDFDNPSLKLWSYGSNDDFRLNPGGGLMKLVVDKSILRMRRHPESGHDYKIEFYPPGHSEYQDLLSKCDRELPNGGRLYGWI